MPDPLRQEVIAAAHTIVVKVGTRVLTRPDATLNTERIARLAEELASIADAGRKVVLVSSGAVGAGVGLMKLDKRPSDVARLQAVAAVGQTHLIQYYDEVFTRHGRRAAQVLLTGEDLHHRQRYLNVRNALLSILEFGAVPIINENDTVAVDELMITFGDNDRLAAMVTNLLRAPLLVILSDVAGLYDGDPAKPGSQLLSTVKKIDDTVLGYVRDKLTGLSKGGMASKLSAAKMVTTSGENCLIASGRQDDVLTQIMAGEPIGTLFLSQGKAISPYKRWLGFSAQPKGRVSVDDGARRAIVEQGRSLLAIGVTHVDGKFAKGDVIALYDGQGQLIARGLTNYNVDDLQRIKGLKSPRIAEVLGTEPYAEVIHRDNLVVV
jgi:glutamate 5-kinase